MNKQHRKNEHQRSIHVFTKQPLSPVEGKRPLDSLREIIGLATASTGIFVTLLYLAGRNFASGYFAAMNIPSYQVSFSLWEYGEVAWLPMIVYPALMFALASLVWIILYSVGNWIILPLIRFIQKKISTWFPKSKTTTQSPRSKPNKQLLESLLMILVSLLIILLLLFVNFTLSFVRSWGELTGELNVLQNSAQIDIVSTASLNLDNEVVNNPDQYLYTNYKLLSFNEGKYYIFQDIDPATCKPLRVYIIDSKNLTQVSLSTAVSLENKCSKELPKDIVSIIKYLVFK